MILRKYMLLHITVINIGTVFSTSRFLGIMELTVFLLYFLTWRLLVFVQITFERKRFATCLTFEWFLTGVCLNVSSQVWLVSKWFITFCTFEWFFSGMCTKVALRSEEHTSELQSRETISYAVFCLKKKKQKQKKKKQIKTSQLEW